MTTLTCSVDGCEKPIHNKANGWCQMHYYRHYRYGDVNGGGAQTRHRKLSVQEQFKSYIKVADSDCHEWQGGLLKSGYGGFRSRPAHRWIWEHANGAIPIGLLVRHKCDNPPCVNVDHLELGTVADNSNDMVIRGRSLIGVLNHANKLTEQQVLEIKKAIRDRTALQKDLALKYGVTPTLITSIKKGRAWTHITL